MSNERERPIRMGRKAPLSLYRDQNGIDIGFQGEKPLRS